MRPLRTIPTRDALRRAGGAHALVPAQPPRAPSTRTVAGPRSGAAVATGFGLRLARRAHALPRAGAVRSPATATRAAPRLRAAVATRLLLRRASRAHTFARAGSVRSPATARGAVVTSDHGDYLGDHWMGEKELFHEASVRVPLIIYDPRPEADATRGTASDAFVEAIDLVPTFIEATGAPPCPHRLEGRSLMPLLRGETPADWRGAVFSEIDYGFYAARETLGVGPSDARGYMIRTDAWKYIHFKGYPPQLFDLVRDPDEFTDLGRDPAYAATREVMHR
ncbi:MAG: sulfatase/phosphatase domain-containing protein, partial [Myxococcota bacterium]